MRALPSCLLASTLLTSLAGCGGDSGAATASATGSGGTTATGSTSSTGTTSSSTATSSATTTGGTTATGTAGTTATGTAGDTGYTTDHSGGMSCVPECTGDGDCTISGQDKGYTCTGGTCMTAACTTQQECEVQLSGWKILSPCMMLGDCGGPGSQKVCIDVGGGEGHCAFTPDHDCPLVMLDEVMWTDIEGNPVTICGEAHAACDMSTGACYVDCTQDSDCRAIQFPKCNTTTHHCECGSDADCQAAGVAGHTACYGGACGCSSDAECAAAGLGDFCSDAGVCSCSGDQACASYPTNFDGTTPMCISD